MPRYTISIPKTVKPATENMQEITKKEQFVSLLDVYGMRLAKLYKFRDFQYCENKSKKLKDKVHALLKDLPELPRPYKGLLRFQKWRTQIQCF